MQNAPNLGFRVLVHAYAKQFTLAMGMPLSDAEAENYLFKERSRFSIYDSVEDMLFSQMMLANVQTMVLANQAASENPPDGVMAAMNKVGARFIALVKALNTYRKVYNLNPQFAPIEKTRYSHGWTPEMQAVHDAEDRGAGGTGVGRRTWRNRSKRRNEQVFHVAMPRPKG